MTALSSAGHPAVIWACWADDDPVMK